jgi:hypothetical protein
MKTFVVGKQEYISVEKQWQDYRMFAIDAHGSQMYGVLPYAFHLATVEYILIEHGFHEHDYVCAAWLHDVLEDTKVKLDKIFQNYGGRVTSLVYSCTGEGPTRKERNESIYAKLLKYPEAAPIKVADRLSNVNNCIKNITEPGVMDKLNMYVAEWPTFRAHVRGLMLDEPRKASLWDYLELTMEKAIESISEPGEESPESE